MELRRLAETVVRRSLLAVPGISQVVPIGGEVREYLVELDPAAVVQAGIPVEEVVRALEAASAVPAAGFHSTAARSTSSAASAARAFDRRPREHRPARPGRDPAAARPDRDRERGRRSPPGARPPTAASRR